MIAQDLFSLPVRSIRLSVELYSVTLQRYFKKDDQHVVNKI